MREIREFMSFYVDSEAHDLSFVSHQWVIPICTILGSKFCEMEIPNGAKGTTIHELRDIE